DAFIKANPTVEARKFIEDMTREIEVGQVFTGRVTATKPQLGAFVEIVPGQDGLIHISELAHGHVDKTEDVLRVGDEVQVKVIEVDKENGRIRLSRRALLPRQSQASGSPPERPRRGGPARGRDSARQGPSGRHRAGPDAPRGGTDAEPKAYFREKKRR
ncbi:MAG: S1 RNA-binding domain-containing protein, partial [Armatimonadota bacterium]